MAQNTVNINGVEYVQVADNEKRGEGDYVIVRTHWAGVHAGYLMGPRGGEVTLSRARRIWYWEGAASLSQLAMEGTSKPEMCKFPCEVFEQYLTGVIEILSVTSAAQKIIQAVEVWRV